MTTWRMAMRAGNQGYSMWPMCRDLGVAAITYLELRDVDLSKYDEFEPAALWACLSSTQHASLGRVAYKFQKGDIIYVKEGPSIAGKGVVEGSYQYDKSGRLVSPYGNPWRHQVPVKWDADFEPIEILLGAEPTTVLELSGRRLQTLERAIANRTS